MKKYTIEVSEDQLILIAHCLEDISRFSSGQWWLDWTIGEMLKGLPFDEMMRRRDAVDSCLKQARNVLFPNMPENASTGYNGSVFTGNVYQIYRAILHRLAVDNNWCNVYSSPALPSGDMGTVKVEQVKGE